MDIEDYKKIRNSGDLRKYCYALARAVEDIALSDAIPESSTVYAYLRSAHFSLLQASWYNGSFDAEKYEYFDITQP